MTLNKKFAALFSMLLFAACLIISSDAVAQNPDFEFSTFVPGDTLNIVIPDTIGVQADWDSLRNRYDPERLDTDVARAEITQAGYYRIVIKILYNSGDEQTNETFYMNVRHPDGTVVAPADSNAGPYKVVFDDPGPRHTAWRDAGLFFFAEGQNTLQMHHIATIMDEYPELLDGPLGPSESVKVTDSLRVIQELAPENKVDLSISLSSATDSTILIDGNPVYVVLPGGNIDYTLTVFNNSPDTAENVTVSDLLPSEFNLQNISLAPTRATGDSLIWEFPLIEPNSSRQIVYNGTVNSDITKDDSLLITYAELSSPDDSTAFNNTADDTVHVVFPVIAPNENVDLSISLVSDTDSTITRNGKQINVTEPGGNVAYTLTLFNNTPKTANDVTLSNLLPARFNLGNISLTPTRTLGDSLIWEFPSIEANGSRQILYDGTVDADAPENDSLLIASAELFSPNDTTAFNNSAEDTVLIQFPVIAPNENVDLSISLVSNTDSTIFRNGEQINVTEPGGNVAYTLTLFNNTPKTANDVTLSNLLPARFNLGNLSLTPTRTSGDSLIWEFPSIEPNGSRQILYDGTVDADVPENDSLLISTAELFSPNDTTAFNNTAEDTVLIQFAVVAPNENVDLSISLVSDTDSTITRNGKEISLTHPGGDVEYTLTVFNRTPKTARDITLVNVISPFFNVSDISRTPNRVAGDSLIWDVPSLTPFASLQIVYNGTVDISFPENDSLLVADAELFSPNDTTEYNNSASDTALVKAQGNIASKTVDVGVTLVSSTGSIVVTDGDTINVTFPEGLIEYTLTVFNNGPDSATNVTLINLLSSDFTLDDISRTPDEISGNLLTWNISSMAPASEIEIQYNGTATSGLSQNDVIFSTANVEAPNDTNAFNNSDSDSVLIQIPALEPPEIEATPALVDVTDSISVRIQIPPNTASWDLWIRFPDGEIDTDFGDDFISANNLTPDVWYEVDENYNPEFLITTAKREPLIFEIRATDIFGNEASAQSMVEVISSNYLVLDRNVFRPEAETPLGIRFKLSNRRVARLDIYDIAGRHITKLTEDVYQGGWNTYPWDGITETGQRAGSGVYLVTLRSGEFNSWKKFIIVR